MWVHPCVPPPITCPLTAPRPTHIPRCRLQHQANLAIIDRTNVSLVMRWTGAVVAEYNKVVAWPLESLKLDDLYDLYKAREARDACNLAYTLQVWCRERRDVGVGRR